MIIQSIDQFIDVTPGIVQKLSRDMIDFLFKEGGFQKLHKEHEAHIIHTIMLHGRKYQFHLIFREVDHA